jgi:hypothetical protein
LEGGRREITWIKYVTPVELTYLHRTELVLKQAQYLKVKFKKSNKTGLVVEALNRI